MTDIKQNNEHSIIRDFSIILMVTLTAVSVAMFIGSQIVSSNKAEVELRVKAQQQLVELKEILKAPIWDFDNKEIEIIGNAYFQNEFTGSMTIKGIDGEILFAKEKPVEQSLFLLESTIDYHDQAIGRVSFSASGDYLKQLERDFLWSYFVTIMVMLLTTLLIAGLFLRVLLGRSLQNFIEHVEGFSKGDEKAFEKGKSYIEFNPLVTALKNMDIGQKRAEEMTLELAELHERIINESPIGLAIYDNTGQCIAGNTSVAEMIGATRDQVLQQNYNELESWKKSGLLNAAKESIRLQEKQRHEFDVVSSFKKQAFYDCLFVPFKLRSEQHLLLMVDDISERKQSEAELDMHRHQLAELVDERTEELKQAQDELMLVVDTLSGFFYRDTIGEIYGVGSDMSMPVYITKGVEELTGYSVDEFMDKDGVEKYLNIIHPDDREVTWANTMEAVAAHREFEGNHRIITHDGEERWVYERGHGVYDQDGKPIYIEGYIIDDHERKLAEDELDKHRDHLEHLVDERTSELKNAQNELVRQGRLATLGQLTATVSHELRNPLGAMRPSLYLMKKSLGDQADKKFLRAYDRIDRNIDRCDHIIDELLDFTRVTDLDKRPARLDEWLDSIIVEQEISQGIEVVKDFSLKNLEMDIDPGRLSRAVINVVENGCQAMLDSQHSDKVMKSSQLIIKTAEVDRGVAISITDTGSGIEDAVRAKIFEPLFSTKGFGVGLGMTVVKQIVEQHGGRIEIDSEVDKGTTVILWLPNSTVTEKQGFEL